MSANAKNVLVVEDESVLRASMVAGLAKLKTTNVSGAATLQEAVSALDATPPHVVVSDIDLPDGLGVSLIGELLKRDLHVPIIFVTAYRAAYGSLIPPHAGVEVLEKPVSLDTLRHVVAARLGDDDVPASPFTVADYVQLSCMGRHSVTIDVEWRDGGGRVDIVQGDLWAASDPSGGGEAAFRRLAFRRDVKIRCVATEAAPGQRNIDLPWESVLMESARLQDEEQRASRPKIERAATVVYPMDDFSDLDEPATNEAAKPPQAIEERTTTLPSMGAVRPPHAGAPDVAPSRPTIQARVAAPTDDPFDALCDKAIAALMAKDYRAAVDAFGKARALRPDDAKVCANLARLSAMGFEPER